MVGLLKKDDIPLIFVQEVEEGPPLVFAASLPRRPLTLRLSRRREGWDLAVISLRAAGVEPTSPPVGLPAR
jgi:hypothetical protein